MSPWYEGAVSLSSVLGQPAIETLRHALTADRVHHAYRFEGPAGVGKEKAALALAEELICGPEKDADPDSLRRVRTFSEGPPAVPLHPDLVIIERGLYPPELIGRSRPEITEISVDQVRRRVLSHGSFAPHEGLARVFLIRRAEELSISAANALLKTLEEPHRGTHFILLTEKVDRLLPTILSRTLPIRFGPLPSSVLTAILKAHGVPEEQHAAAIELCAGSASAALEVATDDGRIARQDFIKKVLEAVRSRDFGAAVTLGESVDKNRAGLGDLLRALNAHLARAARRRVETQPDDAGRLARQYDVVAEAIRNLEANASPTLTTMNLVATLKRT